jgi:hypothetical protein
LDTELSLTTSKHHDNLNLSDLTAVPAQATETSTPRNAQATIIVKIWINYDPVAQEFYHQPDDRRALSCGKVILSPRQRTRITALLRHENRGFQRIRLDIGTPFRPLAHIFVEVMPPELMPPPGRQQQQYGQGRSQPWLATSIVVADAAARLRDMTQELWDFLCVGHETIRVEAPAYARVAGGGCVILLEDLERWAGYLLHRRPRAHVRQSDYGLRRYVQARPDWGFGSL